MSGQEDALVALRREFGGWYAIWFQAGQFCCCRRDNGAVCRRGEAEDLRREMDSDYRACPVMIW
jgi:hypothetical protein